MTLSWSTLQPRLARYLPAELFNRLRALPQNLAEVGPEASADIARELRAAIRALEPLERVLVNYMPRYLLELDPVPGEPHGEILEGSFIFADVTGFTALTELLARQGQARGHETMNQIMNDLFSTLLDPLITSGGDLLFFIGDAVLAYFPGQAHDEDVLQAIRAALRMQRAILPFAELETEFGPSSLTMSTGVARGLTYAGVVGTKQRMELLISGPATAEAAQAEGQAEPRQVRLNPQARAIAEGHFTLAGPVVIDDLGPVLDDYEISLPARKAGRTVILSMEISEILQALEATLQRVERLAPFLPEDMLAHLVNSTDRRRRLRSEFRPVASQFIYIIGLEDLAVTRSAELATAVFQRYFVRAQEIVNRHEGVINQVDAFGKNFILLNTFGVPKAHEGTRRYAISAALELSRLLDQVNREFKLDPPLQQRSGITHGLTFNGEIGAKYRRESVIAGPAVNRAARLMGKAQPGQVILDADIWADTRAAFVGERLAAVTLKGIERPVVIVNVRQLRQGTRLQPLDRPLVGCESEQARLAAALEALRDPHRPEGSAWLVSGETGLGKTSLMSYLAQIARQRELMVLVGRCQPHGKHIPLFPWLDLLMGWLDVDQSIEPGQQRARLATELASLGLSASENALADLLALPAGEKPASQTPAQPATSRGPSMLNMLNSKLKQAESSASPPQATPGGLNDLLNRRLTKAKDAGQTMWQRLEERVSGPRIIGKLLEKLAERQPLLVILEDIHWLDKDSLALLHDLSAQVSDLALMLVVTGREPVGEDSALRPLRLSPLADVAIEQVAQRALGARTLDDSLAQWICQQAEGTPLYAHELCQALLDSEAVWLDRDTGEARWTGQVPTLPLSLHELLLARFDQLPLTQQDVLTRGAVMGLSFERDGLLTLFQDRLKEVELEAALAGTVQNSFLTAIQDILYCFNHSLMQETIYSTLSFAQRQVWHTRIGDWLVERQPELDQFPELVAYHYLRGADANKAARFGRRAGDRARQWSSYAGALEYYQQVLALADAPSDERMRAAEGQADVLALQGDYAAACEAYTTASRLGSTNALGKQAILSGRVELLAQTEFTPGLRPWAEGARTWLLDQTGQSELALDVARAGLKVAEGASRVALETLIKILESGEPLGEYETWLHQFVHAVLGESS